MNPTNRLLYAGGIPEKRDSVAELDRFIGLRHASVVAAADLGDETTARDLVGEFSDGFPGDVFDGHLDPKIS